MFDLLQPSTKSDATKLFLYIHEKKIALGTRTTWNAIKMWISRIKTMRKWIKLFVDDNIKMIKRNCACENCKLKKKRRKSHVSNGGGGACCLFKYTALCFFFFSKTVQRSKRHNMKEHKRMRKLDLSLMQERTNCDRYQKIEISIIIYTPSLMFYQQHLVAFRFFSRSSCFVFSAKIEKFPMNG